MTIREALTATINFPLPSNSIELALINAGLSPNDTYAKASERDIALCTIKLLFTLLTSADVTEDDVSIKLPSRDVLLKMYAAMCKTWGIADELSVAKPSVRQVRFW